MRSSTWLRTLRPHTLLWVSVGVAALTIVLKTLAWLVTDSVSLLSDALESFVNLASALFALLMVSLAQRPADAEHPYGHHKAEYFSSGFEGILIIGAALGIVTAAVERLWNPQPVVHLSWGLTLSILSAALNGGLGGVMLKAAKVHSSVALEADARHLLTDVWTSVGVVLGLLLGLLTNWLWLDTAVAIAVALHILKEGVTLIWRSSQGLMDEALEPEIVERIENTLARFSGASQASGPIRFDHFRSRRAGQRHHVELHLHLPADWSLGHATDLRNRVEQALMHEVPGLRATIQLLSSDREVHFKDSPKPL